MLWELTLRFNVLPAAATAALLAHLCALPMSGLEAPPRLRLLGSERERGYGCTGLSIATRQMVPFIATLLLMVLLCEFAAVRDHGWV